MADENNIREAIITNLFPELQGIAVIQLASNLRLPNRRGSAVEFADTIRLVVRPYESKCLEDFDHEAQALAREWANTYKPIPEGSVKITMFFQGTGRLCGFYTALIMDRNGEPQEVVINLKNWGFKPPAISATQAVISPAQVRRALMSAGSEESSQFVSKMTTIRFKARELENGTEVSEAEHADAARHLEWMDGILQSHFSDKTRLLFNPPKIQQLEKFER